MSRALVIVSKSLAPYRIRFYREVAGCLSLSGWQTTLIVANAGASDHPWRNPGQGDSSLRIVEAGAGNQQRTFWKRLRKIAKLPVDSASPSARLFQELAACDPDVVWTHEYSPFCLAAAGWASLHDRTCLLSTELGDSPPSYACTRKGLLLHRAASFLYQGVIAQTKEATRRDHPEGAPVVLAPHAVDISEYHPREGPANTPFRFLFTGSLDDRKGLLRLIAAGRILASEGRRFELRILGSGPLSAWLSQQTDPWIHPGGFMEGEHLRKEYRDADAYVLPTIGDTYAVTVHEAAASGLPLVIGRNAGSVETLLDDGTTGFIIETEESSEIAAHMARLLDDPEAARLMGMAARTKAEAYDVKLLGRRTAEFILDIVGNEPYVRRENPIQSGPVTEKPEAGSVAAVFATMNRAEVAAECVRRLGADPVRPGKVFVTDNASSDNTVSRLEQTADETALPHRIIRSGSNLGNAGGIKLAIEAAFSEGFQAVWILDDDSWPEPGALARLLDGDLPAQSIRSSLVLSPESEDVSWACEIPGETGGWRSMENRGDLAGGDWTRLRRSWLGALIPARIYEDAGPLIGELFLRGEDEEYPRRLESAGYQFWMSSKSILRHPVGGPYANLAFGDYRICLERNLSGNKLYYRIRNLIWIKARDAGEIFAMLLACGILFLLILHFRPLLPALGIFGEAFRDALSGRLGERTKRPSV